MNNFAKILLILSLLLVTGAYTHAHEDDVLAQEDTSVETSSETEVMEDDSSEVMTDSSTTTMESDEDTMMEEEMTEEELAEALEGAEALEDEDVDSLEDLEGEVIAVTDDEVLIETENGEVVVVSNDTYTKQTSKGIVSGSRRKVFIGEKIEVGTIDTSSTTEVMITTKSGTYTVPSTTVVAKGDSTVALADIEDGDDIVAVIDANGDIVSLALVSEAVDEVPGGNTVLWIIIALVVIILLAMIFRKKKPDTIV